MELQTFSFTPNTGWSVSEFPALDSKNTLVVVFGASDQASIETPLKTCLDHYPQAQVVGCSTAGEILGTELSDGSLSVAIMKFEHTRVSVYYEEVADPSASFDVGLSLSEGLTADDLRGVFVLSEGLKVNGTGLTAGLNQGIPDNVTVTGGLAGDGDRFQCTWVIRDRVPCQGVVSAVGFYGDAIRLGHGSKGGWDAFGPERVVTRSESNVLYELDGRPALELYKEYLGDRADELPASGLLFPLAMRNSADEEKRVVRTILAVDEETQSITFAGDIPEGALVQLMRANFDRLVEGASDAADMVTLPETHTGPILSIAISCVGRRLVLGERTEEEIEAILDVLPEQAEQVGFYSYGEISPFASGQCDLHNQTMTLTTISEVA